MFDRSRRIGLFALMFSLMSTNNFIIKSSIPPSWRLCTTSDPARKRPHPASGRSRQAQRPNPRHDGDDLQIPIQIVDLGVSLFPFVYCAGVSVSPGALEPMMPVESLTHRFARLGSGLWTIGCIEGASPLYGPSLLFSFVPLVAIFCCTDNAFFHLPHRIELRLCDGIDLIR
jgi:hypothetical protein